MALLHRLTRDRRLTTVLDQAIISITNFLPGLAAAKLLPTSEFGKFALVQVSFIMALSMGRAAFAEVGMLSGGGHRARLASVDNTAIYGATLAVVAICVLSATTSTAPGIISITIFGLLTMMVQDALRLGLVGAGYPKRALLNDACWLAAMCGCLIVIMSGAVPRDSWGLLMVWGLSSVPAAVIGSFALGWRGPRLRRGASFARSNLRQSGWFTADWAIKNGVLQVATYGVALVGGVSTVAGIRAAHLLLGPMNVLFSGISVAILPQVVALRENALEQLPRVLRKASALLAITSTTLGICLTLTPTHWLSLIVGEQAEGVSRFILPSAISLAASGLITGSSIGLRALAAGRRLILSRIATSALTAALGLGAFALTGDALGALWGFAAGALLSVPIWELLFYRTVRDRLPNRLDDVVDRYATRGHQGVGAGTPKRRRRP